MNAKFTAKLILNHILTLLENETYFIFKVKPFQTVIKPRGGTSWKGHQSITGPQK